MTQSADHSDSRPTHTVIGKVARAIFEWVAGLGVALTFIGSFLVPQGSLPAWLLFGGGWQVWAELAIGVVISLTAGALLSGPLFVLDALIGRRRKRAADKSAAP